MPDDQKTKEELIEELNALRSRVTELEQAGGGKGGEPSEESEQTFRMVFENAPDGMLLADTESKKFLIGNAAICQMLGYTRQEIVELRIVDIHPDEDLPHAIGQFQKVARREISVARNIPVKRKDGTSFHADISTCVTELSGRTYLMGIFRDVTDRKEAEEALRESEVKFRTLSGNIPGMVYRARADWSVDFIANSEHLCGYLPQEFYQQQVKWLDLINAEDREAIHAEGSKLAQAEATSVQEYRITTRDGNIRWVEDHKTSKFTADGDFLGIDGVVFDITERTQVEKALQESEQKYRNLISNIPDVIYTTDSEGNMTFISSNVEKIYGYTPQEIYEQNDLLWLGRIHPDDLQRVKQAYSALFEKNVGFDVDYRIKRKDGQWIWLHDRSIAAYEKGGVRYADGIFCDATVRKVVETALRENQANLTMAQQIADIGSWTWDIETGKVGWSDVTYRVFGFEPDEFEPKYEDFLDCVHPDDRETVTRTNEKAMTQTGPVDYEYRVVRTDGTEGTIRSRGQVFHDESGNPLRFLGTIQDVTEHKRAENALRESEQKYRTLVESAGESIASIDKNGVFLFMNATGAERLGSKPEDYIGKTMWDLFPRAHADRQMASIRKVMEEGHGRTFTSLTELKGQSRWHTTTIEPLRLGGDGRITGVIVIARDIHELRQAEEELGKYRERMAHAERLASLGTLSATVAHELTQPLTVIRLSLDNLLDDLRATSSPEAFTRKLENSLAEVSSLTTIIDRFRNFARKSSETTVGPVNLQAVAEKIVTLLSTSAQRAKVELYFKDMDKLPFAHVNERDIEQLFFALFQNAIQAADGKKVRELVISGAVKNQRIELRFADTCGGIAPEDLDAVLDPFFTTKPPGQGTGLGLCIVQEIAFRAGGKVSIESEFGKGTTFFVTLPLAPNRMQGPERSICVRR